MGNSALGKQNQKTLKLENGNNYKGETLNNKPHGEGRLVEKEVGRYIGGFFKGKKQGKGKLFFLNGEFYNGDWLGDEKHGYGEYYFTDNSRYAGSFKNNQKDGAGKLYNFDNSCFTGQFNKDKREGKGQLVKKNGETFEQNWKDGVLINEVKIDQPITETEDKKTKSIESANNIIENEGPELNFEAIYKDNQLGSINQSSLRNAGPETLSMMEFKEKVENIGDRVADKPINKWGYEEVAKVLSNFNLQQFTNIFITNRIKGKALLLLTEEDLKDLGIVKIGDKIKMRDLINKLRKLDKIFKQNKRGTKKGNYIYLNEKTRLINNGESIYDNDEIIEEESNSSYSDKTKKEFNSVKSFQDNKNIMSAVRVDRKSSNTSIHKNLSRKNSNYISSITLNSHKSDTRNKKHWNNLFLKLRSRSLNLNRSFELIEDKKFVSQNVSEKTFGDASIKAMKSENGEKAEVSLNSSSSNSDSSENSLVKKKFFKNRKFDFTDEIGPDLAKFLVEKDALDIQEVVGEGAYGQVFKGKYLKTEVAVKIFNKNKFKKEIRKNFIQEAELLCLFRSPFIVLFMGICLDYKDYMIITEYMSQGSLFDYMHKKKLRLSTDMTLNVIESVAHGMNHLHKTKVLHCDLKSSNILVV